MALLTWLPLTSTRTTLYAALVFAIPAFLVNYRHLIGWRRPRYPPSPRSLPLLGHFLWLSSGYIHLDFIKIAKYLESDIIFLRIFGKKFIILNSAKAASEILEKRSVIYSDRLCPPFGKDPNLFDLSDNLALLGYNDVWRHERQHQTAGLLRRLLSQSSHPRPFEMAEEFFFVMGSAMLKFGYGYQLESKEDIFFQETQLVINRIVKSLAPTSFAVNPFPLLNDIPGWFPGMGWKHTTREWRKHKESVYKSLHEWTESQVLAGTAGPSILGHLLRDEDITTGLGPEEKEKRLKELAIALYRVTGGTETTSGTLMKFVAAMVLNPDIQAKAQKEIDFVVGSDTLPKMSDRDRLPYTRSLILEVLRWHTVSPTGIPHVCSQDDTYRDYNIEKGLVIMVNTWAMSRDETVYKNSESFNPDRFLDPSVPQLPVFGWGRRMYPGTHFVESALFIIIRSLLATFTFSTKKDEEGSDIIPQVKGTPDPPTLTLQPFEFEFKIRSELHRKLILAHNTTSN